jgi:hypothetical protein
MAAVTGKSVATVAVVPLKPFIAVTVTLAFLDGDQAVRRVGRSLDTEVRVGWECRYLLRSFDNQKHDAGEEN